MKENSNPIPLGQVALSSEEMDELFDYANRLSLSADKFSHRKGRLIQILINAYISACKDDSNVPSWIKDAIGGTDEGNDD
jgi:hypothetical protein